MSVKIVFRCVRVTQQKNHQVILLAPVEAFYSGGVGTEDRMQLVVDDRNIWGDFIEGGNYCLEIYPCTKPEPASFAEAVGDEPPGIMRTQPAQ